MEPLRITSAIYGVDSAFINVKPHLDRLIKGGNLTIETNTPVHSMWDDPVPGKGKKLVIEWSRVTCSGTKSYNEAGGFLQYRVFL